MVKDRPDWCVSRQRSWGVPLTIFIDKTGEPLRDKDIMDKIISEVEKMVQIFGSHLMPLNF